MHLRRKRKQDLWSVHTTHVAADFGSQQGAGDDSMSGACSSHTMPRITERALHTQDYMMARSFHRSAIHAPKAAVHTTWHEFKVAARAESSRPACRRPRQRCVEYSTRQRDRTQLHSPHHVGRQPRRRTGAHCRSRVCAYAGVGARRQAAAARATRVARA